MSFDKVWYTLEEAIHKFGLEDRILIKWIDEGLIRTETDEKDILRVNIDDLELKVQELTGI
ncbi:MAG TPA: MerR family transcriptional regulator [Desulfuromonadaceae bacterium]